MAFIPPLGINNQIRENLNGSLAIPSTFHTYSVMTEYMKNWFLNRFGSNPFKHIHIENKHVYDDMRGFNIPDVMKRNSPVLAIIPKINLEFNRDLLDTNPYGIDMLIRTGRLDNSIIRDYRKNIFVGYGLEQLSLQYSFIIKVETKAQQLDFYKFLTMAFPFSHNYCDEIDMDFHVPYGLMVQMAKDAGYTINEKGNINDVAGFVRYLNSISRLPILYKYRTVNGHNEFFMRFENLDISMYLLTPPSADDGERKGHIQKNYRIEFDIDVRCPSPKFFMYYSSNAHDHINGVIVNNTEAKDPEVIYPVYSIEMTSIPKINDKGWNQYLLTTYYEEEIDNPIVIEFKDLIKGNLDMDRVIDECESLGIEPSMFIDFKLYNGVNKDVPYTIDWKNYTITPDIKFESIHTTISLYIDTAYVFERIQMMDKLNATRLK